MQAPPALAQEPDGLTRRDYIAAMDAESANRDADKDGNLTTAEYQQFERNIALNAALVENRRLFAQVDADGNGMISPQEFTALVGQPPVPDVSSQMRMLDQNHDGTVTIVEHRAAKLVNFDRLDTDFDGIVTDAEMAAGNVPTPVNSGR